MTRPAGTARRSAADYQASAAAVPVEDHRASAAATATAAWVYHQVAPPPYHLRCPHSAQVAAPMPWPAGTPRRSAAADYHASAAAAAVEDHRASEAATATAAWVYHQVALPPYHLRWRRTRHVRARGGGGQRGVQGGGVAVDSAEHEATDVTEREAADEASQISRRRRIAQCTRRQSGGGQRRT
jgi:hypothetical protein